MSTVDTLEHLYQLIEKQKGADPKESYVAKRMKQGTPKITQKLGEEAVETVIAAMQNDKKEVVAESADMLFHWLLLMVEQGLPLSDVMDELMRREGMLRIEEKKRRKGDV
ncbi:MAG: phosphoribosyl-ATP diphosphatase [Rickettsiales bacterium]